MYKKERKSLIISEINRKKRPLTELAEQYGVSLSTLYRWKNEMRPAEQVHASKRLEKELKKLKKERYILLHAMAILAKET